MVEHDQLGQFHLWSTDAWPAVVVEPGNLVAMLSLYLWSTDAWPAKVVEPGHDWWQCSVSPVIARCLAGKSGGNAQFHLWSPDARPAVVVEPGQLEHVDTTLELQLMPHGHEAAEGPRLATTIPI